ncbi:MAG: hypothetical protein JXA97_08220 [Anaerolineales bacterium]|nr:hypothetical protein [Anaerolineales bacterium]
MKVKPSFTLSLYSTKNLLITFLGLIVTGTLLLVGAQTIWSIPAWVQYAYLTVMIAGSFFASQALATQPADVQLIDRTIHINQRGKSSVIPLDAVRAYAFYEELFLYSLIISMQGKETLSMIRFKWSSNTGFQSFLKQFEILVNAGEAKKEAGAVQRSETFYGPKARTSITLVLLLAYIGCVILLFRKNAFIAWNPIGVYYFWVIPVAFFIKMWRAK